MQQMLTTMHIHTAIVRRHEQAHGVRRDAFATSGEAQSLRGCRLDAHRVDVHADVAGNQRAHRWDMRSNARLLAHDGDVDVADRIFWSL
jgi:hypothetical protein